MEVRNLVLFDVNLRSFKRSTVVPLLLLFWLIHFHPTNGNYYSATHPSYIGSDFNITPFAGIQIAGTATLGSFGCRFYNRNLCNWPLVSLKNPSTLDFPRIWEKLDGSQLKAKPCAEYCTVKYGGDCEACRGYSNLRGLDCDLAPQVCSDYTETTTTEWGWFPVWPWGFYNRMLNVSCYNKQTVMIRVGYETSSGPRILYTLGWSAERKPTSVAQLSAMAKDIDWALISELQQMSTWKKLYLNVTIGYSANFVRAYTGFKISPNGSLSLNGTSMTYAYSGFNIPIKDVPFIYDPSGSDDFCGPFWQLSSEPVCKQHIRLMNLQKVVWNGEQSAYFGFALLTFD